ncbi:fimbrin, partial [Coemansia sp. S100]
MSQQDIQRLSKKNPILKPWDIETLVSSFNGLDLDANRGLERRNVVAAVQKIEPERQYDEISSVLKEVDVSRPDKVELDEFVELIARLRTADKAKQGSAPAVAAKAFEGITSDRA